VLVGHQILLKYDPSHDFATNDACGVRCKCFQRGCNCQGSTDALAQENRNVPTYLRKCSRIEPLQKAASLFGKRKCGVL